MNTGLDLVGLMDFFLGRVGGSFVRSLLHPNEIINIVKSTKSEVKRNEGSIIDIFLMFCKINWFCMVFKITFNKF